MGEGCGQVLSWARRRLAHCLMFDTRRWLALTGTGGVQIETAPFDPRFVTTNQAKHCYTRYNEFHKYDRPTHPFQTLLQAIAARCPQCESSSL
jgi:hypothetical protein